MFEDYIQDAYSFFTLALKEENLGNEREAKMYFRAAIFCAASSIEAFVNFIGDTFKKADNIDRHELSYINDKILEFSPEKISVTEKSKFNPIDGKLKFIIKRFNVPIDISSASQWKDFLDFKALRDSLVHAKTTNDDTTISDYKLRIKKGLNANIDLMNLISNTIFSRPLRKGLTELKIA